MRRVLTLFGFALLFAAIPSRAHAWWEFIEEFSGPGRFYGWDVDFRLFCLVDEVDTSKSERIQSTEKVLPTSAGVVISFCKAKPKDGTKYYARRLSVNVGARFLTARDNDDFAHGEPINLTIVEPSVSMNLLNRWPTLDFVDFGAGAGVYWFASSEFPSFSGFLIEPVRIELHPTTAMKEHKWAAAIPVLRFAWLSFPTGFDRAKFVPTNPLPLRIGRDTPFNFSLSFDLEPLFR
jgi:hypothetical protein